MLPVAACPIATAMEIGRVDALKRRETRWQIQSWPRVEPKQLSRQRPASPILGGAAVDVFSRLGFRAGKVRLRKTQVEATHEDLTIETFISGQ